MTSDGWGGLRHLLRTRAYRQLLGSRIFAQLSDGSFQVGLAGLFFFSPQRATTPTAVAWALTASLLPYTIIGPFAGVLLDRWWRRDVLLAATAIRATLIVITGFLVYHGVLNAALFVVVLSCLSVDRFVLAGLSTGLPHVVTAKELVLANSITPTIGSIATITGGALAFGVSQLLGGDDNAAALTMALTVALCVLSGAVISRLGREQLGPDGGPSREPWSRQLMTLAAGMAGGARYLWTTRDARWAMVLTAAIRIGFGVFAIVTILLSRNTFATSVDAGLTLVATVAGLAGAGAGMAAVIAPIGARLLGLHRWTLLCLALMICVYLGFALTMSRQTLVALALPLGLAVQGVKVAVDTTVQTVVDDDYLGRAFSLYDMTFNASFVVAALLAVLVVPVSGLAPGLWLALVAVLVVVSVATALRRPAAVRAGRLGRPFEQS